MRAVPFRPFCSSDVRESYSFFIKHYLDSLDVSFRSKQFYAWKGILLWINYNNLNIKKLENTDYYLSIFKSRSDYQFINKFMGLKRDSNIGFICASWYWHFVDAIWIVVISVIYSDLLIITYLTIEYYVKLVIFTLIDYFFWFFYLLKSYF